MDLRCLGILIETVFFSKRPINPNQNFQQKINSLNKTLTQNRGQIYFFNEVRKMGKGWARKEAAQSRVYHQCGKPNLLPSFSFR